MFSKLVITFGILLYAVAVPILDVSVTHVFNPDWTPHARIHEVWQLITNSSLGLFCLWLTWHRGQIIMSALLSLSVTGGFLIAFALQDSYGGSMKYLDGSEKTLFGINIGVVGFGLVVILLIAVLFLERKRGLIDSTNQ
jgi:hypothetical protein|tara:strand:- start:4015 stop:4431 length:417 start_codon:yes stop_codon:yes gene_type:complete